MTINELIFLMKEGWIKVVNIVKDLFPRKMVFDPCQDVVRKENLC